MSLFPAAQAWDQPRYNDVHGSKINEDVRRVSLLRTLHAVHAVQPRLWVGPTNGSDLFIYLFGDVSGIQKHPL
jgi:hypothetical protein